MNRRTWTPESVLTEIRTLHNGGSSINSRSVRDIPIHGAARHHFGSWGKAVEAAGFDYDDVKKKPGPKLIWTSEKVLRTIRDKMNSGEPLNAGHIVKNHAGLYSGAVRHFGSWKNAVEVTGYDYDFVRVNLSWNSDMVSEAIKCRDAVGLPITLVAVKKEDRRLLSAAKFHFGSWGKAVRAAKFRRTKSDGRVKWSKEIIIEQIKKLQKLGTSPHYSGIAAGGFLNLYYAGIRYFGTWPAALEEAGLSPGDIIRSWYKGYWSKEKIIQNVKLLVELGFAINVGCVSKTHSKLYSAAKDYFGSWKKAVEAAGFNYGEVKLTRHGYWNKERILSEIKKLEASGQRLNFQNVRGIDSALLARAWAYFGSWKNAVEAAGFDYFAHRLNWSMRMWLDRISQDEAYELGQVAYELDYLIRTNKRRRSK